MNSLQQSHLLWSLNPLDNGEILILWEHHQGPHQPKYWKQDFFRYRGL